MRKRQLGMKRYEMRWRIREALSRQGDKGVTMQEIATQSGKSLESVRLVINGKLHTPGILKALRENGVAEEYLFDPAKQQEAQ